MKKFDVFKAEEGHPIQTRDGRKARILTFNRKSDAGRFPIVGLVTLNDGTETIKEFTNSGACNKEYRAFDLFMESTEEEGWINVCRVDRRSYRQGGRIYCTRDEAISRFNDEDIEYESSLERIDTIKIKWEE